MSATKPTVYLSYAWPDRRYADSLRASLASRQIASVVDDLDFQSGQALQQEIDHKLEGAQAVIVVVGETTHQSAFVEREALLASKLSKPVVVVKLAPEFVLPPVLYDVAATWTDTSRCEDAVAAALDQLKRE